MADPAPGTPGNSGGHNPHGSPPGQGGTAPGGSGAANPHGSPPGQRIPSGSPGAGVTPPVGGAAATGPAVGRVGGRAADPLADTSREFVSEFLRDRDQFVAELGRLKGWEPEWRMMALAFESVHVDASFRQTASDGSVFERMTSWWKRGDREAGQTLYPGQGRSDWRFDAGRYAQRWNQNPWNVIPMGMHRRSTTAQPGWEVLNAWEAEPGTIRRDSGGRLIFRLPLRDRTGAIELEAQEGSRLVEALRGYGPAGRLRWHEMRRFDHWSGRMVVTGRERRWFDPAGMVQVEQCRWTSAPEGNLAESLAAMDAW